MDRSVQHFRRVLDINFNNICMYNVHPWCPIALNGWLVGRLLATMCMHTEIYFHIIIAYRNAYSRTHARIPKYRYSTIPYNNNIIKRIMAVAVRLIYDIAAAIAVIAHSCLNTHSYTFYSIRKQQSS